MKNWRLISILLVGFLKLNCIDGQPLDDHKNNDETSKLETGDYEEIFTSDKNKEIPSSIEVKEPSTDACKSVIEEGKNNKDIEHVANERILNPENNECPSLEMSQTNESHEDILKSKDTEAGLPVENPGRRESILSENRENDLSPQSHNEKNHSTNEDVDEQKEYGSEVANLLESADNEYLTPEQIPTRRKLKNDQEIEVNGTVRTLSEDSADMAALTNSQKTRPTIETSEPFPISNKGLASEDPKNILLSESEDETIPIPDGDAREISQPTVTLVSEDIKEKTAPIEEGSTFKSDETISLSNSVEESHERTLTSSTREARDSTIENSKGNEHKIFGATDNGEKFSTSKIFMEVPTFKHYAQNPSDKESAIRVNDAEKISEVEENEEFTFPTQEYVQSVADGKDHVSITEVDEKPTISKGKKKLSFVPEHLVEELTFRNDAELQKNDIEKAFRKDTGKMPLLNEDSNHQKVGYSQQISIDKPLTFENMERGESSGAYASFDVLRKNVAATSTSREYNDREQLIQPRISLIDDYTPPISDLELSISARYLNKTHSICVVYVQPSDGRSLWIEYQRTEIISNDGNPDYKNKIVLPFKFGKLQPIKLEIHGFDPDAENLTDTSIGVATFNLAQLLFRGRGLVKLDLNYGSGQPTRSFVTISLLELPIAKKSAQIRMEVDASIGRGFHALTLVGVKPSHFRSFITIYIFIDETNEFKEIHETETVRTTSASTKNRSHLQWEPISLPYATLSKGDHDRRLKFVCWRAGATGENETIGEFEISLKQLRRDRSRRFSLIDPESKNKTSDSWINIRYFHVCSFVNYIMGGLKMETLIGIDFSVPAQYTNGVKGDPNSLHNIDFSTNRLNVYEETLTSIIPIMEEYSLDKQFSVYGFPGFSPTKDPLRTYEEIFHVNLNPKSSICTGMEGIMTAYRNVLQQIDRFNHELNLIPIIEEVTRLARKNPKHYYILLILTTGDIFYPDYLLGKTMEALKNASSHPVSIIIIGLGDRNSKFFELIETNFQYSEREIVKFVPAEKFISEARVDRSRLASEAVAKIPSQFLSYMLQNNILPKDPSTDAIYLTSNRTINN